MCFTCSSVIVCGKYNIVTEKSRFMCNIIIEFRTRKELMSFERNEYHMADRIINVTRKNGLTVAL